MSQFLTICVCWGLGLVGMHADAGTDSHAIEVVKGKFTAFNRHDSAAIENIYAGHAVLNSPDYRNLVGNKPIAETYRKLFDAIPDAKDDIELLEAVGSHVYVQFVLSGHWNGTPDKPINVRIMAVYQVSEGRIIDDATYYDRKAS